MFGLGFLAGLAAGVVLTIGGLCVLVWLLGYVTDEERETMTLSE